MTFKEMARLQALEEKRQALQAFLKTLDDATGDISVTVETRNLGSARFSSRNTMLPVEQIIKSLQGCLRDEIAQIEADLMLAGVEL